MSAGESGSFGRYRECRANTVGRVELVHERVRFGGFSPRLETDFNITIARNGEVTGTSNDKPIKGHFTANDGLHLGDIEFDVKQESYGFQATQKDDRENVIYFRKR